MLLFSICNAVNAAQPALPEAPDPVDPDGASDLLPLPGALGAGGDPAGHDVVGGSPVPEGKWDDAVGVVFSSSYVGCTGTLVGPRVVLTAAHCAIGTNVTHVLVGSKDWSREGGEIIEVDGVYPHPDSDRTYDIAVLTLARRASVEPRAIAIDCILRDHLADGANVQIVGFGLTTESGTGWNTMLNEAPSAVLDHDCDEAVINGLLAGCKGAVSPGGEIAAGGDGVDACYGDSGGPLYLKTGDKPYLVGVTSRAFVGISPNAPCRDGGIWVRPDAVLSWIEEKAGNLAITYPVCNEAPDALVDDIFTTAGLPGRTTVDVDDPDGDDGEATIEVVEAPERGEVEVDGFDLIYTPDDDDFVGEDAFTIRITDAGIPSKPRTGTPVSIEVDVAVEVAEPELEDDGDDLEDDEAELVPLPGCGCGGGTGGSPVLAGLLALVARRRGPFTRRRRA